MYTDFGLTVVWNGNSGAIITILKETFFGNTCGLCGTCNDVKRDEFTTNTGELVSADLIYINYIIFEIQCS